MSWMRGWAGRVRSLLLRDREEREMEEEIGFHLEMEERKLRAEGLSAEEARRQARVRFGGEDRMKEHTRDERGTRVVEDGLRDVRYAFRSLRRAPGFAAVVVATLSLGVGATTAVYTLVDGVVMRPLPYPESQRIVGVWERSEEGGSLYASYLNFADWRRAAHGLEALAAFVPTTPETLLTGVGGVRGRVAVVSADFFAVGGIAPERGRLPTTEEQLPDGPPVAVVSHDFWQNVLGAPVDLDGVTVDRQGTVFDVVGVMPPRFTLPAAPDIWVSLDRAVPWSVRGNHVVGVMGRLAPGASVRSVSQELDAAHAAIRESAPEVESVGVTVRPYLEQVVGDARKALGILLAASALLLLVACTNVASMLLARGRTRARELGVRASLGASRARLVRQLMMEASALAFLGAVGGVLIAQAILMATRALDAAAVPRLEEVSLHPGVLAFTLAVAVCTAVLFGLLPALTSTRDDIAAAVRAGRTGFSRRTHLVWRMILGGEVAMAMVLLVCGGLLVRSLQSILSWDGGFQTERVITGRVDLPIGKYDSWEQVSQMLGGVVAEVAASGDVEEAGIVFRLPGTAESGIASHLKLPNGESTDGPFEYRVADSGYFRTLSIPLIRGRLFESTDGPDQPHVALVDEDMARALWPGQDPVGRTFNPAGMDPWPQEPLTVAGVLGNVTSWDRVGRRGPGYYVNAAQRPAFVGLFGGTFVVRTRHADVGATLLRLAVKRADGDAPIRISTLARELAQGASDRRFTAFVMAGFALAALLLAAVGVYGIVAYTVSQRTREMGIRIALGARPSEVRSGIQGDVLGTVAWGGAAGLVAALFATRLLSQQLFQVSTTDPTTFLVCLGVLGTAAWVASWVPAWRGTRVDPALVLQEE